MQEVRPAPALERINLIPLHITACSHTQASDFLACTFCMCRHRYFRTKWCPFYQQVRHPWGFNCLNIISWYCASLSGSVARIDVFFSSFVEIMTVSFRKQFVDFLSSPGGQGVKCHFAVGKLVFTQNNVTFSFSEASFLWNSSKFPQPNSVYETLSIFTWLKSKTHLNWVAPGKLRSDEDKLQQWPLGLTRWRRLMHL